MPRNEKTINFLHHFLDFQPCIFLDGGLATELERYGADLNDPLWSAKILYEDDTILRKVYRDYLRAGADIIATASYQASVKGFINKGFSISDAINLIKKSVVIAKEERDEFWCDEVTRQNRRMPLVAASNGPYGAFLADGSEYSGQYNLSYDSLYNFHEERIKLLETQSPDLYAFETIPQILEIEAIVDLMKNFTNMTSWLSMSCKDDKTLVSGESLNSAIKILDNSENILAIGVNCIMPDKVLGIVKSIKSCSNKPIIVYPNKGEKWDAEQKVWKSGTANRSSLASFGKIWNQHGVQIIGGCCRTTPYDIAELRKALMTSYNEAI